MFAKLTTKIALRKAGIPSNALAVPDFSGQPNGSKDGNANAALPFANPFKDMQVPKALKSWQTPLPPPVEVADTPILGTRAPNSMKFRLPAEDGRSTLVVFLRHTGCPCSFFQLLYVLLQMSIPLSAHSLTYLLAPVAEKNFLELRRIANKYPQLHCVAISHASKAATDRWITQIGGAWAVKVVIDEEREVYASWGLGVSTTYHLLNPWTQVAIRKLGTNENIWAREVDPSANRWQVGGCWATDESKCYFTLADLDCGIANSCWNLDTSVLFKSYSIVCICVSKLACAFWTEGTSVCEVKVMPLSQVFPIKGRRAMPHLSDCAPSSLEKSSLFPGSRHIQIHANLLQWVL